MKRSRRFVIALLVVLVLASAAVKADSTMSGWYYDVGWWWPFSYCIWYETIWDNGSWWYWDTCGNSYGYMSLD